MKNDYFETGEEVLIGKQQFLVVKFLKVEFPQADRELIKELRKLSSTSGNLAIDVSGKPLQEIGSKGAWHDILRFLLARNCKVVLMTGNGSNDYEISTPGAVEMIAKEDVINKSIFE